MPRKGTRLMRAATARKLAAITTRILLSNSKNPRTWGSKAPVVETFGQRLAERERGELGILAVRVEQRLALLADQHLLHPAEEDGVWAGPQLLLPAGGERGPRADQHRRAGRNGRPGARI